MCRTSHEPWEGDHWTGWSIEPIVPLGHLVSKLGCNLQWTQDGLVVVHPVRGQVPTMLKDGCPMIAKKLALRLIEELEEKAEGTMKSLKEEDDPMTKWIQRLVEEHPVFKNLPVEVKSKLVVKPQVYNICGNRRRRKLWKREGGVTVYLYTQERRTAIPMKELSKNWRSPKSHPSGHQEWRQVGHGRWTRLRRDPEHGD